MNIFNQQKRHRHNGRLSGFTKHYDCIALHFDMVPARIGALSCILQYSFHWARSYRILWGYHGIHKYPYIIVSEKNIRTTVDHPGMCTQCALYCVSFLIRSYGGETFTCCSGYLLYTIGSRGHARETVTRRLALRARGGRPPFTYST